MRLRLFAALAAAVTVSLTASPALADTRAHVVSDATLPRMPLSEFGTGPRTIDDDHGIALGGIGSDLYPAGREGTYWMVTDRGPNGQIEVDGEDRRTFPTPGFTPTIVQVRVAGAELDVLRAIPLRGATGAPITGLSNQEGRDETPYTWDASTELDFDPSGLDTEGLVRAPDGTFWLSDEYSPSLVHVGPGGRILARYVPKGLDLEGADYPVVEALPAVLLHRESNRGIEALAMSPDGRHVSFAMQSPLDLPGEDPRNDRLFAFDTLTKRAVAEYVYRFEDVRDFDPGAEGDQLEMKISGLVALDRHRLLVDERTDDVTRLYVADLRGATSRTPVSKRLALDLGDLPNPPTKVEGIAMPDPRTLVVANDNDFGMSDGRAAFDENGDLRDSGVPSRLVTIRLSASLV